MAVEYRPLTPEHQVIEVIITEDFDITKSLAQLEDVAAMQEETGLWGLLLNVVHASHQATLPEVLDFADALSMPDLPPQWRAAYLRPVDPRTAMVVDYFEVAANNRGFPVAVFRDRDDALAWLDGGYRETGRRASAVVAEENGP